MGRERGDRLRTLVVCVELMCGHWHGGAAAGLSLLRFLFADLALVAGTVWIAFDASRRDRVCRGDTVAGAPMWPSLWGSALNPSSSSSSSAGSSGLVDIVCSDAPLRGHPLRRVTGCAGCAALPLPFRLAFVGDGTAIVTTVADRRLAIVGLCAAEVAFALDLRFARG